MKSIGLEQEFTGKVSITRTLIQSEVRKEKALRVWQNALWSKSRG